MDRDDHGVAKGGVWHHASGKPAMHPARPTAARLALLMMGARRRPPRRSPLPLSIILVVGARPNFVKVAPLLHALARLDDVRPSLLHTGQHYDWALSQAFIEQLGLPEPEDYLNVGSGSHAEQTAGVLVGVERVLEQRRPDALVVAGDVNSTMAAALAAAKTGTPVAHLESGLRSRDWSMPEEVNRAVTDRVSDLLLCPSQDAVDNLVREGVGPGPDCAGGKHDDRQPAPAAAGRARDWRGGSLWARARRLRVRDLAPSGGCRRSGRAGGAARGAARHGLASFPWSSPCIRARGRTSSAATRDP